MTELKKELNAIPLSRRSLLAAALLSPYQLAQACAFGTHVIERKLSDAPGRVGADNVVSFLISQHPELASAKPQKSEQIEIITPAWPQNSSAHRLTVDYQQRLPKEVLQSHLYLVLEHQLHYFDARNQRLIQPAFEQLATYRFHRPARGMVVMRFKSSHQEFRLHAVVVYEDATGLHLFQRRSPILHGGQPCQRHHYR